MKQCLNIPCTTTLSDQCIIYTGESIPELGICQGDRLSQIEAVILEKLLSYTTGSGIVLSTIIQSCQEVQNQMLGKDNSLSNFIQALINVACSLDSRVTVIEDQPIVVYDTKCLTVSATDEAAIIQSLINTVCTLNTSVTEITNQLINSGDLNTTIVNTSGNLIKSAITTCGDWGLTKTGNGNNTKVEIFGLVPPYSPIMCYAPLSNFDSTGKGRPGGPFCGWYILNGNNGMPDWQGYTPGMATNLPGITRSKPLDGRVGGFPAGSYFLSNLGDKKGEVQVGLSAAQIPPHTHPVNQDPHSHTYPLAGDAWVTTVSPSSPGGKIRVQGLGIGSSSTTGSYAHVTVQPNTGGQHHYNIQPTVYCYYIARLPEKPIFDVSYIEPNTLFINTETVPVILS